MPEVSDCGKYLMLFIMKGCKDMLLYFSNLEQAGGLTGKLDFVKVVTEFDSDYDVSKLPYRKLICECATQR